MTHGDVVRSTGVIVSRFNDSFSHQCGLDAVTIDLLDTNGATDFRHERCGEFRARR